MRFFRARSSPHPSVLWDKKTERPIYAFSLGVFETEDPEIIGIMLAMGFPTEPVDVRVQMSGEIAADAAKPPPPPAPANVPETEAQAMMKISTVRQ